MIVWYKRKAFKMASESKTAQSSSVETQPDNQLKNKSYLKMDYTKYLH